LFERSEFSQTPPDASSARHRGSDHGCGLPFLGLLYFGKAKESEAPPVAYRPTKRYQ
jgi:hypothetical protein